MRIKGLLMSSCLTIGLLAGCSGDLNMSTDEIISNVLAADKELTSYYAEGEMKYFEGDKEKGTHLTKEYIGQDGKRKIVMIDQKTKDETVSLNDGKEIITYDEKENKAYTMDVGSLDFPERTQREQLITLIEGVKETHDYEIIGEEKVNGFLTHHIKLKPKKEKSLLGEMEFWVDQKTWFFVKSVSSVGENRTEMTYKKLDTSPKFTDDTFTIQLPKDVEMTAIDDFGPKLGTIEEAEKGLGKPFLVLNEEGFTAGDIEIYEGKGELARTELSITYLKDENPQFILSVIPTPTEPEMKIDDNGLKVRGQNAENMEEIKALSWDEGGLRYSIIISHPDLSQDDVIKMTENMKLSSDK